MQPITGEPGLLGDRVAITCDVGRQERLASVRRGSAGVEAALAPRSHNVGSIAYQPADFGKIPRGI